MTKDPSISQPSNANIASFLISSTAEAAAALDKAS